MSSDLGGVVGGVVVVQRPRARVERARPPAPVAPGVLVLAHPLLAVRGGVRLQRALRQGVGPRAHLLRCGVELVERRREN